MFFFNHLNQNQESVFIPIGPDNEVFGTASVGVFAQSALFLAGGGTVSMSFDGQSFTWQITSNNNNGSKGAIPANTSNHVCDNGSISDKTEYYIADAHAVYPNPSSGQLFIQIGREFKESVKL